MNRKTAALMAGIGLAAAAGVAVIVVLLFGGSSNSPRAPGTDAGIAIDPLGTEPADVAITVMSGLFTWQPAVHDSSWDALHSQQGYLTGAMAIAAAQRPTPAPQPLPEWAAWSRSGDTITAVVTPDGGAAVGRDRATVPVTINQTVQHLDGDITPYTTFTATVTLENKSDSWKVNNYVLTDSTR